ncbi:hypothetical protein [Francisella frigiditurris]|nr:hypothetical protein [Francisella frigiditurris]
MKPKTISAISTLLSTFIVLNSKNKIKIEIVKTFLGKKPKVRVIK